MKKYLLKGIMALLCLTFLATPAMSANLFDHVSIAPNQKGDLLVYPLFMAGSGVETSFEVINTSNTDSVVAKVIVRSHHYSRELLDFLIYLTPNDVFKGTLKYDGGKYVLVSTDGSMCINACPSLTCASAAAPLEFELSDPCDGIVDSKDFGYITVIESWSISALENVTPHLLKGTDGTIDKADLCDAYALFVDGTYEPRTINVLTGFGELIFPGADYALFLPTIFKDYENEWPLNVSRLTVLGENSNNTLCEIEAALSKNNLAIPYYDNGSEFTVPIYTFPTKLSECPPIVDNGDVLGPFFEDVVDGNTPPYTPEYTFILYDMEEHSYHSTCPVSPCPEGDTLTFPEEVNILVVDSTYDEGWGRLSFAQSTSCETLDEDSITYTGAPVIGLIAELTTNGLSLMPPAYDFGAITYGASPVEFGPNSDGCYQLGCINGG